MRAIQYVSKLVLKGADLGPRPAFRVLDEAGKVFADSSVVKAEENVDVLRELYRNMVRLQTMDQVFYEAQRQGRITFYMTTSGEEGVNIGSASGLQEEDMVFAQYREAGVLLQRGWPIQKFADQCFANIGDAAKGRQMPVHYGSKELNFQTISSPLATQIPQATGAAYAAKGGNTVVAVYFGEGAASEGDFHPALNFASTLECPVLFICRNNQYAISTPVSEQYGGDGIVSRADGYGMTSCRVDGNCILGVREAVKEARKYAIENSKPVLIETMTYRQGHHSTSDDSTRYRELDEIEKWKQNAHPITRLKLYMEGLGCWSEDMEEDLRATERENVLRAVRLAEEKEKPDMFSIFEDVYQEMPKALQEQRDRLKRFVKKYPNIYTHDDHHHHH